MRHGRQDQFERHALGRKPAQRLAEHRHVMPDFAAAASRQHQQHRRLLRPAAFARRDRAAASRSARSGDGRHSCRAGRAACDIPPARTAAAPARDRHSGASRAPGRAATPRPRARHNRRSGSTGSRARTRRATRWVKSGLSMMTSMSGEACVTASAVSRIRRRIIGSCFTTAASPMIDSSSIGNSVVRPSRAIDWPPTPSKRTAPPSRWRNTFIRLAPSRSPDSSVAIRNIFRATSPVVRAGITPATPSRTGLPRRRPRSWPAVRRRWYCRRRWRCRQARP